jgi:hypothetical protein
LSIFKKILLGLLVLTLVVLIIVFWGSVASIVFTMGLIMIIPTYLFNRFINSDKTSDFIDDENQ